MLILMLMLMLMKTLMQMLTLMLMQMQRVSPDKRQNPKEANSNQQNAPTVTKA